LKQTRIIEIGEVYTGSRKYMI